MSLVVVSCLDSCAPVDAGMSDERLDISDGARTSAQDPANENASVRSFEQVILPHLDAAYNLARWLTRDPALAEDVVQDACIRALQYFDSLRGENGQAWFLRIVRNTAYSRLRGLRTGIEVPLGDGDGPDGEGFGMDVADPDLGPEMALVVSEDCARLDAAIAALPAHLRECLVLRCMEELSYKEIARVVGVPVGTIMSRLHRARRKLLEVETPPA